MRLSYLVLLSALSTPAFAQQPAAAPAAVPAATTATPTATAAPTTATGSPTMVANAAKPKMICETEDTIGTRLGAHKVCMTADQWRERRRESREMVDSKSRAGMMGTGH